MGLARGQQFPAPITAGCSPRPWAATFLGGTPRAAQGGGCLHQGGHGQGCGCLQPGWNYSWHSISLSTGLYPLPAVGMWGPDFLPFCQAISWCPTSAHWCWQAEAHSELCHVCPTLRATLAHPGAPYQHLAHPKAGKGVTHKEVTPGARSPKLGSARVLLGPNPAPHHPQLDGKAAPAHAVSMGMSPASSGPAHTGALHKLMSPEHSWILGSGPHPYSINGTLTSATASD